MKLKVRLFGKNFIKKTPVQEIIKDLKLEEQLVDYYFMTINCKNCGQDTNIYIKKGVHLNDIIGGVNCKNCEVKLEKI